MKKFLPIAQYIFTIIASGLIAALILSNIVSASLPSSTTPVSSGQTITSRGWNDILYAIGNTSTTTNSSIIYKLVNSSSVDPGHKHTSAGISGTLSVSVGGTGASTLTGVLFGNGTSAVTGTSTLSVGYGGTGATSLTGILVGNGNGAFTATSSIGTNYLPSFGTVTSVAMTAPTGLTISGSPITTSGTLVLGLDTGYKLLSNNASSTWDLKQNAITDGTNLTFSGTTLNVDDPFSVTKGNITNASTTDITVRNLWASNSGAWLSNGFLGVKVSPTVELDVAGQIRNRVASGGIAQTIYNTSTNNSWQLYPQTNGSNTDLRFYESSATADRITFQAGGNLGVGTTSPGSLLSVNSTGNVYFGGALTVSGNSLFSNATTTGLTVQGGTLLGSLSAGAATTTSLSVTGGGLFGSLGVTGLFTFDKMTGTAATTSALTITGGASFASATFSATSTMNGYVLCTAGNGACAGAGGISSLNGLTGGTQTFASNNLLSISSAGTVHTFQASTSPSFGSVYATSTIPSYFLGNVGIGTTNPTSLLTVAGGASFINATSTNSLFIPAGTFTLTATGQIAINTTQASSSIQFYDGTATRAIYDLQPRTFTIASTTITSMGGTTGTSTIPLGASYGSETWTGVNCYTDTGTAVYRLGDGTNFTSFFVANTTAGWNTISQSFPYNSKRQVQVGAWASSPNALTCSVIYRRLPNQ